jgi:hypothetical protein
MVQCKKCGSLHDGAFGSGKFCSRKCANSRDLSDGQKESIRKSLIKEGTFEVVACKNCQKDFKAPKRRNAKFCSRSCSDKMKMIDSEKRATPDSIWKMSSRTRCKLLQRMGKGCCRCGWNEAPCDLHHINGRDIPNPHASSNLTLLCPNCHRLYHTKKIGPNDVVSIDVYLSNWKEYYYG